MDVFNLLSYINKISLFAFFITTLVVGYQIYFLKKEKFKEKIPTIPDFKENNNFNVITNFTNLPSSLAKKELKTINYSKLVFLIISLLTIIIVIFVVSLINKNNFTRNQVSISPSTVISPTPTRKSILPTVKIVLSPSPAVAPTIIFTSPTIVSTEIILAQAPSFTPTLNPTNSRKITDSVPKVLPETGSREKGLLIIGVAILTIFFSFLF